MRLFRKSTALLLLLTLTACERSPAEPKPTLHEVMAGSIDPIADVVWETSSKAYGEDGTGKPGKLTDADWLKIQHAARELHDGATIIIENPDIAATRPGVKILDEGVVAEAITAKQVAAYLDRDRPGLSRHARELSNLALGIESAAKARNAVKTVRLSEDLDDVCESCHKQFWYPDQPKPVTARIP
ncbi:MAG TPA: hypothetical protein VHG29_01315 [Novosphingobium sp.]|nr:hypothetical protein [Novosphingobium sp.]